MQSVKNPDARLNNDMKRGTALFLCSTQAGLGLNSLLPLFATINFNDSTSIIKISSTEIKLLAGKKYHLRACLAGDLTTAGYLNCAWFNVTASSNIGNTAVPITTPYAGLSFQNNVAEAEIITSVDTLISMKVTATSANTTLTTVDTLSHAYIEEVEAYIPVLSSTTVKITQNISGAITYPLVELGAGIVESGSNTNGSYIKFSDGTLIQWGKNLIQGVWIVQCSLPTSFIDADYNIVGSLTTGYGAGISLSAGFLRNYTWGFTCTANYSTDLVSFSSGAWCDWQAIGRWKA